MPVDRVSLEVEKGELFVLLGASGSGKSTILRMIAGLVLPDEGRISIHGRDVTLLPPQARDVGLVFQNYSIFRHMTVGQNIEFGLRIRRVKAAERRKRRDELLDLVGLGGLGSRFESQLSGGQRQRVALARALAYKPGVLLLDEPFGALDVKIRVQLRQSLKEIQKTLGVTTVLVTHDQEEAFELGHAHRGHRARTAPGGRAAAAALREPAFPLRRDVPRRRHRPRRPLPQSQGRARAADASDPGGRAARGGRPGSRPDPPRARLPFRGEEGDAPTLGQGEVVEQTFAGAACRIRVRLPPMAGVRQVVPPLPFGEENVRLEVAVPAHAEPPPPRPWVALESWHILRQPTPRLLVCDEGEGLAPALEFALPYLSALNGVATVLGVASDARRQDALRESLGARAANVGLRTRRSAFAAASPWSRSSSSSTMRPTTSSSSERARPSRCEGRKSGRRCVAEELALETSIPLLAVRGRPREPERILVCTAIGEPGKSDVRAGGWLARRMNASATLLHVGRPGQATPFADTHLERGVSTLRELGVTGRWAMRDDEDPVDGILGFLRDNPHDLVVVGAPAAGRRFAMRGEAITTRVLRECGISILVVPEGSW